MSIEVIFTIFDCGFMKLFCQKELHITIYFFVFITHLYNFFVPCDTGYLRVSLTRNAEYSSSVWDRGPDPRGTRGTQYRAVLQVYILNDYVERPYVKPLEKFCVVI